MKKNLKAIILQLLSKNNLSVSNIAIETKKMTSGFLQPKNQTVICILKELIDDGMISTFIQFSNSSAAKSRLYQISNLGIKQSHEWKISLDNFLDQCKKQNDASKSMPTEPQFACKDIINDDRIFFKGKTENLHTQENSIKNSQIISSTIKSEEENVSPPLKIENETIETFKDEVCEKIEKSEQTQTDVEELKSQEPTKSSAFITERMKPLPVKKIASDSNDVFSAQIQNFEVEKIVCKEKQTILKNENYKNEINNKEKPAQLILKKKKKKLVFSVLSYLFFQILLIAFLWLRFNKEIFLQFSIQLFSCISLFLLAMLTTRLIVICKTDHTK